MNSTLTNFLAQQLSASVSMQQPQTTPSTHILSPEPRDHFSDVFEIVEAIAPEDLPLLSLVVSILKNVVNCPQQEKYRRIKRSNDKFSNMVQKIPGAIFLLRIAGFLLDEEAIFLPMDAQIERVKKTLDLIVHILVC